MTDYDTNEAKALRRNRILEIAQTGQLYGMGQQRFQDLIAQQIANQSYGYTALTPPTYDNMMQKARKLFKLP